MALSLHQNLSALFHLFGLSNHKKTESSSRVGTVLDTNIEKKNYSTYNYTPEKIEEEYTPTVYPQMEDADIRFAENFTSQGGKYLYCADSEDFKAKLARLLAFIGNPNVFVWEAEVFAFLKELNIAHNPEISIQKQPEIAHAALGFCSGLIAVEGGILLNPQQNNMRPLDIFPKTSIFIAFKNQLYPTIDAAVAAFHKENHDKHPFLMQMEDNPKKLRNINGKFVINAPKPQDLFLIYCDFCGMEA